MNKSLSITVVIFMLIVCCANVTPAFAQNDSHEKVDDVMHGFEDEATAGDDVEGAMHTIDHESDKNLQAPLGVDGILQGFDEEAAEEVRKSSKADKPSPLSLEGELVFTTIYNFSPDANPPWREFSMLRPELELTLKNRFSDRWQGQISARGFYDAIYTLRDRDEYTRQVLDEYEKELELEDTFVQGR
ncbi:MAG: hypothetical protein JSW04_14420, partial [Desulfobacterales bacterium]